MRFCVRVPADTPNLHAVEPERLRGWGVSVHDVDDEATTFALDAENTEDARKQISDFLLSDSTTAGRWLVQRCDT